MAPANTRITIFTVKQGWLSASNRKAAEKKNTSRWMYENKVPDYSSTNEKSKNGDIVLHCCSSRHNFHAHGHHPQKCGTRSFIFNRVFFGDFRHLFPSRRTFYRCSGSDRLCRRYHGFVCLCDDDVEQRRYRRRYLRKNSLLQKLDRTGSHRADPDGRNAVSLFSSGFSGNDPSGGYPC